MNDDLKGRKLLILGANPETVPLVKIANEMGVKTLVTSNRPDDVAKKYAWKACDVDGLDEAGLVNLAKEEEADGVLVGVADILVPTYSKVCSRLNLPCYASSEIVEFFSNKDLFKRICEKYGVMGVPQYKLDISLNGDDLKKIVYPVMVKPVDGYSGLGMTIVYEESHLKEAVDKALSYSKCKRFLVERYMECDDVGLYYTFKDGICSVSCMFDRYTTKKQKGLSKVNLGSVYPSKYLNEYLTGVHGKMVTMFEALGIRNGVLLIQAFYENGEFYVYDPGFRLQGEAPHLLMKHIHGFDQREMLIRFALTGSEGDIDLKLRDNVDFRGKSAATLWVLLKEGVIGEIKGLENVDNDSRVVVNVQRLYEGNVVDKSWIGTEKQVLTRLYLVCDNREKLRHCIEEYENIIRVYDISGNNMVVEWLNSEVI